MDGYQLRRDIWDAGLCVKTPSTNAETGIHPQWPRHILSSLNTAGGMHRRQEGGVTYVLALSIDSGWVFLGGLVFTCFILQVGEDRTILKLQLV